MRLSELATGESAYIIRISGRASFRRRMGEMGFVKGKKIKVIKNAPLKDPIEYSILGYSVSLRRSDANHIEVANTVESSGAKDFTAYNEPVRIGSNLTQSKTRQIKVAFVGNPNSGKTTLYNSITRSHEHTGNYSGVTVDIKSATINHKGAKLSVTDLPGTYSLSTYSPEELFVRDYIINEKPDIIVNVVDASNIERNLFFTTQLLEIGANVVMALNMYDEVERRGDKVDCGKLGKLFGINIIPTVGSKNKGTQELMSAIVETYNSNQGRHKARIDYGIDIEKSISKINAHLEECIQLEDKEVSNRFISLRLLQGDKHIENYINKGKNYWEIKEQAAKEIEKLSSLHNDDPTTLITDTKYGYIAGALKQTYIPGAVKKREITEILDSFLTDKLFGFPIFLFFLWLMFNATFTLGQYPQVALEWCIAQLSKGLDNVLADGSLKDLLIDGIIGGVGGVIVFLPNILILFLFISFMEDSGYMARVVFIMDKIMRRIGLHGKSFIPLIMGFGCNVPAIMASRAIDDKNSRMITMLINPFMSCSARLPVYLLLIGAIFPQNRGSFLFLIYFTGIFLAVVMALFFRKTFFKAKPLPFVLELPPYRIPTVKSVLKHMWFKGSQYLKKMGGVILVASILIWGLSYFPLNKDIPEGLLSQQNEIENRISEQNIEQDSILINKLNEIKHDIKVHELQNSFIGRIGKGLQPVFAPLGFDWKMSISLLSGVVAKEVVVSTLGVLYQIDVETEDDENKLAKTLQNAEYSSGTKKGMKVFNSIATLAFLAFTLIYFPCIAVIAAIKKEASSTGWAVFTIIYTTALAWIFAFLVYQIGLLVS